MNPRWTRHPWRVAHPDPAGRALVRKVKPRMFRCQPRYGELATGPPTDRARARPGVASDGESRFRRRSARRPRVGTGSDAGAQDPLSAVNLGAQARLDGHEREPGSKKSSGVQFAGDQAAGPPLRPASAHGASGHATRNAWSRGRCGQIGWMLGISIDVVSVEIPQLVSLYDVLDSCWFVPIVSCPSCV